MELERAQLDAMQGDLDAMYSEITIDAKPPSGIVYTYTYAEQLDDEVADAAGAEITEALEGMVETSLFPVMIQAGVEEPVSATYVYLNADGSEIYRETFTSD